MSATREARDKARCIRRLGPGLLYALSFVVLIAAPAAASDLVVAPVTVLPGGTITVSGTGCVSTAGRTVLVSGSLALFNGSNFLPVDTDANGHFSVRVHVSSTIPPGSYSILGRCVAPNEPLGPTAGAELGGPFPTFTVTTTLARTGGSVGSLSDTTAAIVALALIAIGAAAIVSARRSVATDARRPGC